MSNEYKGIVLAGGFGTRLHPATKATSKHLLPIFDKPMIYYSISVLMLSNIRDILVISSPADMHSYQALLGDGSRYGLNLSYQIQNSPDGLAQAFLIGENFIDNSPVSLILGDNFFHGPNLSESLNTMSLKPNHAKVFGYTVKDPNRFGIIELDDDGTPISIEEKPLIPKSNIAVTGLYFYPTDVVDIAKEVKPSKRGELEITSINEFYLQERRLSVETLGRGFAWIDCGTSSSLLNASNYVHTLQERQGILIACLEEIAILKKWITPEEAMISHRDNSSEYSQYVKSFL